MKNRKYWILGIIGCILFGIGDWLLGFVDPTPAADQFYVLKAGHGMGYELKKLSITLLSGIIGVPFMMAGCPHIAELVTEKERKKVLKVTLMLLPVGWLLIHFTVTCGIFVYAWSMQNGNQYFALKMVTDMMKMFRSTQYAAYFLVGVPLILLPVFVFRGKMILPKTSQFFTPLLWMGLLSSVKYVIPASPFVNGIDTFCMNAGMIIWFVYLLLKKI